MAEIASDVNVLSPETDSTEGPSYSPFYNDPSAEFIVVSSDGIHFRTHKHILQTMSRVFREMLQIESEQQMCLPDTSSEVLRLALDILSGVKIDPDIFAAQSIYQLEELFEFSEKYDSPIVMFIVCQTLEKKMVPSGEEFSAFRIANRCSSLSLAQRALKQAAPQNPQNNSRRNGYEHYGQRVGFPDRLDIFRMSDGDAESLGFPVYRALVKAHVFDLPRDWHPDFASVPEKYRLP